MRSTFFGIGLFVLLWGSLFLFTDQLEIQPHQNLSSIAGFWTLWNDGHAVFHPPEWAAFSLLSAGGLMMLYAIGLPQAKPHNEQKPRVTLFEGLHDPRNEYARLILSRSLIPLRESSSPLSPRQY